MTEKTRQCSAVIDMEKVQATARLSLVERLKSADYCHFVFDQIGWDAAKRIEELEAPCRALLAWLEGEQSGPDYGSQTRDTHPEGEKIWEEWWNRQLRLCDEAEQLARAALSKRDTANGEVDPVKERAAADRLANALSPIFK